MPAAPQVAAFGVEPENVVEVTEDLRDRLFVPIFFRSGFSRLLCVLPQPADRQTSDEQDVDVQLHPRTLNPSSCYDS